MPGAHERAFQIRHYECDAYGHLNNTTYLRYLEEVEISGGLFPEIVGGVPRIRRTDIEFIQPVAFGRQVTVSVRSGSRWSDGVERKYEFRVAEDDGLVSRAFTLWEIPEGAGWKEAPGESERYEPDSVARLGPIPAPPPPPPDVFIQRRPVEWRDVDQTGRVSPATLSAFAEDCGVDLCSAYGWPLARCTDEGFAMVLRRHQIEYGRLPVLGDELEISTWASDLTRITALRHYLLAGAGGGKPVARFRSRYVWVEPDRMRPIRIPEGFLADFAANFTN